MKLSAVRIAEIITG